MPDYFPLQLLLATFAGWANRHQDGMRRPVPPAGTQYLSVCKQFADGPRPFTKGTDYDSSYLFSY